MVEDPTLRMTAIEKQNLFTKAMGFEGVPATASEALARVAVAKRYSKGDVIFSPDVPCRDFQLVAAGLVKVSIYASSGTRLTYLLAERGEPLNLVGPFTGASRPTSAEAFRDAVVLSVKRQDFMPVAHSHPAIFVNAIDILGKAVDSANLRLLDMVEKRVAQRLARVLYSLYAKFGPTLKFTASELAELAGTTTESTLRTMGYFRKKGFIRTERASIEIIDATPLTPPERENLWL